MLDGCYFRTVISTNMSSSYEIKGFIILVVLSTSFFVLITCNSDSQEEQGILHFSKDFISSFHEFFYWHKFFYVNINPFVPNASFLYPLKTSENRQVERVHWETIRERVIEIGYMGTNGLTNKL